MKGFECNEDYEVKILKAEIKSPLRKECGWHSQLWKFTSLEYIKMSSVIKMKCICNLV